MRALFPENASCRFTAETLGPQVHSHMSPSARTRNQSTHRPREEGAVGTVGKLPHSYGRSWSSRRDREKGQERGQPQPPACTRLTERRGFLSICLWPHPKPCRGSELEPHLPSLAWGLNFLGFKMEMKAAPLWRSGYKGAQHTQEVLTCVN